jgi:hypothetical protein
VFGKQISPQPLFPQLPNPESVLYRGARQPSHGKGRSG